MKKFLTIAATVLTTAVTMWMTTGKIHAFTPFMAPTGQPYHWEVAQLPNQTIVWDLGAGVPSIAGDSITAAFSSWSTATGGKLNSTQGPGGILVDWDTTGTMIPDPLYLAYTTFSSNAAGQITSAHIVVNAVNYTWHRGGYGGVGAPDANGIRDVNLDAVILHELGHALGLNHSDLNPTAIVAPVNPSDPPTMNSVIYPDAGELHNDDQAGIRFIYGSEAPSPVVVTAKPATGNRPLKVNFAQTGGDASTTWNFGDGFTTTGAAAFHKFTANGTYTVTVTANGVSTTTTIQVGKVKLAKPAKQPKK